jgi:hypothetical protein
LLELANRCQELFSVQPPNEKRRLLDFVLSKCIWRDGQLVPTFRKPSALLATAQQTWSQQDEKMAAGATSNGRFDIWLPVLVAQSVLDDESPLRLESLQRRVAEHVRERRVSGRELVGVEWRKLLETGTVSSRAELAQRMGVSRARATQVLRE